jgi:hypothetical protein
MKGREQRRVLARARAHHDAGLLGEQVTTTGCERP